MEYETSDKVRHQKDVDLLNLTPDADVELLVDQIIGQEALISGVSGARSIRRSTRKARMGRVVGR